MRVSPIIGRVFSGKTYAEFQTHTTALAINGVRLWTGVTALAPGKYRTTAATLTGTMYGTSWQSHFTDDSPVARAIQHGVSSQAMIEAQVAAGRQIYFEVADAGTQTSFDALARNGYTSLSYGGWTGRRLVDLLIWTPEGMLRFNPFAGSGPSSYDW